MLSGCFLLALTRIEPRFSCGLDGRLTLPSFPLLTVEYDMRFFFVVPANNKSVDLVAVVQFIAAINPHVRGRIYWTKVSVNTKV